METNYYIYSIVEGKNHTTEPLKGLDEREILLLPYNDICAVISSSERTHYDATLENLERHENAINHFMSKSVVLPMRFSTIVKSKDDVKRVLEKYYLQFRKNIEKIKGKVEMGIKIFYNFNIGEEIETQKGLSGKEYFLKKYNRYLEVKNKLEPYLSLTGEVHNKLSALSAENCCTKPLKNNLLMNASYLIPVENVDKYRKIVEDFRGKHSYFKIILSGPWPPYHFVKVEVGE